MLTTVTIDVGTTSVKLSLFEADGHLVASTRAATPSVQDAEGEVYEVDALTALVTGFLAGLDASQRRSVQRIAITGVGESGGLVRPDLTLASPMILWHDHRGARFLDRLDEVERARVFSSTGLPFNANYGISKVAWAVEQAGDSAAGAQWLNIAEYLAALMTGVRSAEFSLASRTMALDLTSRSWSPEVGALFGVALDVFPELRAAGDGAEISPAFAALTGLSGDVHVHVAGHDHMVGAVGAALRPGELLNSTGTTEGLLMLADSPSVDESTALAKLANGISSTGNEFTLFASIPTGGSAFATLQGLVGQSSDELTETIAALHESYLVGDIDLDAIPLVLPQFRGSPPPTKNAAARGILANIGTETDAAAIVFGSFLGMALQFADVLALFPTAPESIKVIGPASRNPLWLQLKADLLGVPLSVSSFPEVVSRGAQALASGDDFSWESSDPQLVLPDSARHELVSRWSRDIRPQWEHLKSLPARPTTRKAQQ
jgi:sugar (pentulose or hexulose) kinase